MEVTEVPKKRNRNDALTEGWVTNLQPEKTAQDWIRKGFTPEDVWRYLEARCPIPSKAAGLHQLMRSLHVYVSWKYQSLAMLHGLVELVVIDSFLNS